jgi:alpha-L-fucosidase
MRKRARRAYVDSNASRRDICRIDGFVESTQKNLPMLPAKLRTAVTVSKIVCYCVVHSASTIAVAEPVTPVVPPAPQGPTPTVQQRAWHDREFYAFVHFNMNTFTGVEWGQGSERPDRFNPTELDCRQWCSLFRECGLSGVIITAKHHDGFCLWPSKFTEHDVAASPWRGGKGDVIRELADACRENGLWLGIYISPWDRNNPLYGRHDAAYNDYFNGQLEELLSGYGPVAEVWWDGANGDRNNPDKHQEYDWQRFIQTVRRLQPDAVIFAPPYVPGDIRWVGNEAGHAGATQWSTFPAGAAEDPARLNVGVEGADTWMPAETDVSIRPGWYWTSTTNDSVKSVSELLAIYYASVGRNTNLLLNFPVDARGLVHENDAARLRELANILRATFAHDLAARRPATATNVRGGSEQFAAHNLTDDDPSTYWATDDSVRTASAEISLGSPTTFNRVLLQEHIELGQRVRAWRVSARADGKWQQICRGTTIGHKRIACFDAVTADAIRLEIADSRACPVIESLSIFIAPATVSIRPAARVFLERTKIELESDLPGCDIYFTLDGTQPTLQSQRYSGPIVVSGSCVIRAAAARGGELSPRVSSMQLVGHTRDSLRRPVTRRGPLKAGLKVAKYRGGWQTLDQMSGREPFEVGECRQFDVAERLSDEHTALAFEGLLRVPTDGIFELDLGSDDGARLYIGDELIVDNDGLHGMTEKVGYVGLQAGLHPIRVEWFNAGGGMGLKVKWAGPGLEKQAIPPTALVMP